MENEKIWDNKPMVKGKNCTIISLIVFFFVSTIFANLTLTVPFGARTRGMGSTGYALSDDESSLFYNPAGLGLENKRWKGGAVSYNRVSTSNYAINGVSAVYQPPITPRLGYSIYLNRYHRKDDARAPEFTLAAGSGYDLVGTPNSHQGIGFAAKYFNREWYGFSQNEKLHASGFSFDIGYLLVYHQRFRLGVALKNLGPAASIRKGNAVIGSIGNTPTLESGLGTVHSIEGNDLNILKLSAEVDFRKVIHSLGKTGNEEDFSFNSGMELTFLNTVSARLGFGREFSFDNTSLSLG